MSYSSLLRIRPFRNLWLGQAISQIGDAFYFVIFMFMVKKITGSTAAVGYVGALEAIPYLIFGSYAGVLADRIDRRKIMLFSDLVSGIALCLFALALAGRDVAPSWLLFVTPFVLSSVRVFFMPAKGAAIPALVPSDQLQSANGFSMITQNMMPLVGLGLTATVLAVLYASSPKWFFLIAVILDAVSFLGSAAFIAKLPPVLPDRKDAHDTHPITDFREGIRFVRGRRDLVVLIALLTAFRLFVAPFFTVYIAANEAWFGGKPQPLAWFEFSFCAGMVIASAWAGKIESKRPGIAFAVGLAIIGIAVALLGLSPSIARALAGNMSAPIVGLIYTLSFGLFVFWNILAGLAIPFADIPINTYMQLSVPDAFRGRVGAVLQMIATGVMPIGMMLGGIMVQRIGVLAGFLVMGVGMFVVSLAGLLDPAYRAIRMPESGEITGKNSAITLPTLEPDAA